MTTAREQSWTEAHQAMAPDFYNKGIAVGDAVSDVWEPLLREARDLIRERLEPWHRPLLARLDEALGDAVPQPQEA